MEQVRKRTTQLIFLARYDGTRCYNTPSLSATRVGVIRCGMKLHVNGLVGKWARVTHPFRGWVQFDDIAYQEIENNGRK